MKTVLVLSGGGAKGSIQFGILKYLYERGLVIDSAYGTSVGSLNAAGLSFCGIEGMQKVWDSLKKKSDVFKFNWSTLILKSQGIFNASPLKKLLQKVLVGEPKIPAYACKVSLITGEIKYSSCYDSDYIDSIVASSSVPVLTDPVGEWVDGGVREQTPLKRAIDAGADKIIVILCNPYTENPEKGKVGNFLQNALRTSEILSHEIMINDIQSCLWYNKMELPGKRYIKLEVYAPEYLPLGTSDFTQDKIQAGIKHGYEVAQKGPIIKE